MNFDIEKIVEDSRLLDKRSKAWDEITKLFYLFRSNAPVEKIIAELDVLRDRMMELRGSLEYIDKRVSETRKWWNITGSHYPEEIVLKHEDLTDTWRLIKELIDLVISYSHDEDINAIPSGSQKRKLFMSMAARAISGLDSVIKKTSELKNLAKEIE